MAAIADTRSTCSKYVARCCRSVVTTFFFVVSETGRRRCWLLLLLPVPYGWNHTVSIRSERVG